MRTTFEILEDVKSNIDVDKDELKYCLLAIDAMSTMTSSSFHSLLNKEKQWKIAIPLKIENNFYAWKRLLKASPIDWLGDNIPENKEYQSKRRIALGLFNKFSKK
jgi:hypothetical protein